MSLIICFDGRYEGYLVFRAPTNGAAFAFAPEVSVVNFHTTCEDRGLLSLMHDLHNLVFHAPGSSIAYAKESSQLQSRNVILGLREKVNSLKPGS